ncbi:hypothetical protein KI387_027101, partial [Taxus chinensis]
MNRSVRVFRVHSSLMSLCCLGKILPVRPIRPIRVLLAQMSLLLYDCLFSFRPNRLVR